MLAIDRPARGQLLMIGATLLAVTLVASLLVYFTTRKPDPYVSPLMPADGIFGGDSVWQVRVKDAPVAPDSRELVSSLVHQVRDHYDGIAGLNVSQYNMSFYLVRNVDPVRVAFHDCQDKGYIPAQLYDESEGAHFLDVPIPDEALPARGDDGELSIFDPDSDRLWELWKVQRGRGGSWSACWGGRIDNVSESSAQFPDPMGVAATGLTYAGGVIGVREAEIGRIDHAMYLTIIDAAHSSEFSYPALRSDGNLPLGAKGAIEEGRRFRLDPSLDVDRLQLTPIATMIAKAAQTYGFIIADKGGAVTVGIESGLGFAAANDGKNPWNKLLAGVPEHAVLAGFPWHRLQALPRDYAKP